MKKTVVLVGGGSGIAAAVARVLTETPGVVVEIDDTIRPMETDGQNVYYDPKMIQHLSDREFYGITPDEAYNMIIDRRVGEYKIPVKESVRIADNLPEHAKKPTFLLAQNHHIRKVRK